MWSLLYIRWFYLKFYTIRNGFSSCCVLFCYCSWNFFFTSLCIFITLISNFFVLLSLLVFVRSRIHNSNLNIYHKPFLLVCLLMDVFLVDARVSREFRVVRDNRTNHNTNSEIKAPSVRSSISTHELEIPKISEKRCNYVFFYLWCQLAIYLSLPLKFVLRIYLTCQFILIYCVMFLPFPYGTCRLQVSL